MTRYEQYIARKKNEFGDKFSDEALSKQFIPYFNHGDTCRIKVRFPSGEMIWGYVGITTGWMPAFLLMRRRGQHGSEIVLSDQDTLIALPRFVK